jgi:hypothetical protein
LPDQQRPQIALDISPISDGLFFYLKFDIIKSLTHRFKSQNMKKMTIFVILFFILNLIPDLSIQAAEFEPNYIISDEDYSNYRSLSQSEIQQFLEDKNSYLANFISSDINGQMKTAAEIIYQAAQNYQINPQLILVMLQKEQSLVEDDSPEQKQLDWAMGYGVCDDCSMNDPALMIFKGFGAQVDKATARFRWYNDNPTVFKQAGKEYQIDGVSVRLVNQATANLFSYTPHIHGNYNFWKIWQRWFKQFYPDSSLVKTADSPTVYLLEYGLKRPIQSWSAFVSRYSARDIIVISKEELNKYENGSPIKFANYSILQKDDGTTYLLVNDKLRQLDGQETLRLIGYNPEELISVTAKDIENYEIGEILTIQSAYPLGTLLQDKKTGGIYFVQSGIKYPVIDRDILKINFPNYAITAISPDQLAAYEIGDQIKIKNGILIKSADSPVVYITANGERQPIKNEYSFKTLGYRWDNIFTVSQKALATLSVGETIDLKFKN